MARIAAPGTPGFAPIRGLSIPAHDSRTRGTVFQRTARSTWNATGTLSPRLGKQGTALNFKVVRDFPGGLGVQMVWKLRSCGVRLCRVVQGHGIARSPQGAAIAAPSREGSGGLLLQEELSTPSITEGHEAFHRTIHQMEYRGLKHKPEPVQHHPQRWLERLIGKSVTRVAWRP